MRVLIAGGGVAALETVLALRELAAERVEVELLAPTPEFTYKPLAVAEPFGLGESRRYDLGRIAEENGARLRIGALDAVVPEAQRVTTADGEDLRYDVLVLAVGATTADPLPDSVTLQGPGYTSRFRTVLRDLERHRIKRVAFALPPGAGWPLPLYELALMTAGRVAERKLRGAELHFVTPEDSPLELFGPEASAAVATLLEERAISLHPRVYPASVEPDGLAVIPATAGPVPADRVVTMPQLAGPRLRGVPHDPQGFIPVDPHCLVRGEADIYAAGDATNFPVKQGGLAAQQADAVAEAIAARAGALVTPQPFRPILRGMLLTGESPRYLRTELGGAGGDEWDVSEHALWWPPSKIAGRYLSPYLGLRHAEVERRAKHAGARPLEVPLGEEEPAFRRVAVIAPRVSDQRAGRSSVRD